MSGGQGSVRNGDLGQAFGERPTYDGSWNLTFRATLNSESFWGHEFGYGYHRLKFILPLQAQELGTAGHLGFYNFLLYATPNGSRFRPFATGGGQFTNFIFPGGSVQSGGGSTKFGYNYGGGIKVRLTDVWGIRLDYREYASGKPFDFPDSSGLIRLREISAGVAFMY